MILDFVIRNTSNTRKIKYEMRLEYYKENILEMIFIYYYSIIKIFLLLIFPGQTRWRPD